MTFTNKHPLDVGADAVKQAFLTNGFQLFDDGEKQELLPTEKCAAPFSSSSGFTARPILLEDGNFQLRTEQLTAHLPAMKGPLPIQKISCGRVYDGNDQEYPSRLRVEGVIAREGYSLKEYKDFWNRFAISLFGVKGCARLEAVGEDSFEIMAGKEGEELTAIGCTGKGSWLTRTLLDADREGVAVWAFLIQIDQVAMKLSGIGSREELYSCKFCDLERCKDESAAVGDNFLNRLSDLLRRMGYSRFHGMKVYPADIYKKMNMIQEDWDTNNKGVQLVEPLKENTGLPTVLTPSLEQALSECYGAGDKAVKIYDIAHIFLPDPKGGAPAEKIALTMGTYGDQVDSASFKKEVVSFFKQAGINNHFFFPTNMAIAYDTKDTWLVLDEKMHYLESNFGGISKKAEDNHNIGVHCFMANLETIALEEKYKEEFGFTPPELEECR